MLGYSLNDLGFKMWFQLKLCQLYANISGNYFASPTLHLRLTVDLAICGPVATIDCLHVLKFKFAGKGSHRALLILSDAFGGRALQF